MLRVSVMSINDLPLPCFPLNLTDSLQRRLGFASFLGILLFLRSVNSVSVLVSPRVELTVKILRERAYVVNVD